MLLTQGASRLFKDVAVQVISTGACQASRNLIPQGTTILCASPLVYVFLHACSATGSDCDAEGYKLKA
jgi:hypothetical protein